VFLDQAGLVQIGEIRVETAVRDLVVERQVVQRSEDLLPRFCVADRDCELADLEVRQLQRLLEEVVARRFYFRFSFTRFDTAISAGVGISRVGLVRH